MKTLMTILVGLTMSACSGCDPSREEAPERLKLVNVKLWLTGNPDKDYAYSVDVDEYFADGFAGVAQEVEVVNPTIPLFSVPNRFVEFTERDGMFKDGAKDRHTGSRGDVRKMREYPADAEGYAPGHPVLLERGLDGFVSDAHSLLVSQPVIQGSVARHGAVSAWTIEARTDGLHVTINGKTTFYPAP